MELANTNLIRNQQSKIVGKSKYRDTGNKKDSPTGCWLNTV